MQQVYGMHPTIMNIMWHAPTSMNQTCLTCGYFLMEDMEDIYIILYNTSYIRKKNI